MLRSLEIQNYRNLRHLTIEKLGRVNLLVGKNNTGKTSVLEAATLLLHKANPQWLYRILEIRGEIGYGSYGSEDEYLKINLSAISNLFYGRKGTFDPEEGIKIQQGLTDFSDDADVLLLRFASFIEEIDETLGRVSRIEINDDLDGNSKIGLDIATTTGARIVSLDRRLGRSVAFSGLKDNIQFIRTNEIVRDTNGLLWDKITLTPKQEFIIDSLGIIEPKIESLNFVAGLKRDDRRPVIKIKGSLLPIPLGSMGDGINRILTIILAMVNCENGYLLIDEFENGLHYSVQEKLWEVIFYLAERLDIQVFATTHSLDCVEAFSTVLNDGKQDKKAAVMIRLENYEGNIEATVYDADEIQATTRVNVDPR
ncbi:AAA family ATPase [soil metagenome]